MPNCRLWAVFLIVLLSCSLPVFGQPLNDNEPLIKIGETDASKSSAKPKGTAAQSPATAAPTKNDPIPVEIDQLKKLAEGGNAEAQYQLAMNFLSGGLVEKSEKEAATWLLMAANQNLPKAQTAYGVLCRNGAGVDKDLPRAVKWFRPAVEAGFLRANVELGTMYFDGIGVSRDHIEAYVLLKSAVRIINSEPGDAYAPAKKALETLEKDLSGEQKELAKAKIDEMRDRRLFRTLK